MRPPLRGAGAEALDPQTGKLLATVPLGAAPSSVAVGAGAVWVLDANDKTISAIDPETRSRERSSAPRPPRPTSPQVPGRSGSGTRFAKLPFSPTSYPESVSRLDPETRVVVATIPLPRPKRRSVQPVDTFPRLLEHIAVTSDAVWVVGADLGVYRIDPRTNQRVGGRVKGVKAMGIAAGDGGVWVIEFGRPASRRSIRARTRSRRGSESRLKASARSPLAPATSGRRTRSVASCGVSTPA